MLLTEATPVVHFHYQNPATKINTSYPFLHMACKIAQDISTEDLHVDMSHNDTRHSDGSR